MDIILLYTGCDNMVVNNIITNKTRNEIYNVVYVALRIRIEPGRPKITLVNFGPKPPDM